MIDVLCQRCRSCTDEELLQAIMVANLNMVESSAFHWPNALPDTPAGSIAFDVNAPKGTWVIKAVEGVDSMVTEPIDRDYDHWPHVGGTPPAISFERTM